MMRIRVSTLVLLVAASVAAFALPAQGLPAAPGKDETLDQLIARAESSRPEERPALYLEIARQKGTFSPGYLKDEAAMAESKK